MLITCPECGKQISDKAPACIHCGYPLNTTELSNKKIYKLVSDNEYNKKRPALLAEALRNILNVSRDEDWAKAAQIIKQNHPIITGLTFDDANMLKTRFEQLRVKVEIVEETKPGGVQIDISEYLKPKVPYCPKCGSTSITTGARGVDGFWGFLGASRTVNRCANCGHSWEPRG